MKRMNSDESFQEMVQSQGSDIVYMGTYNDYENVSEAENTEFQPQFASSPIPEDSLNIHEDIEKDNRTHDDYKKDESLH
ncbi:hypothetical protein JTB14_014401 [Gonioctena quinquepunctata]|nr:hypothetical protein JTB14_014401 [Gonioctena quinquepunctata]